MGFLSNFFCGGTCKAQCPEGTKQEVEELREENARATANYKSAEDNYNQCTGEKKELDKKIDELESQIEDMSDQLEQQEEALKTFDAIKKEKERLEKELNALKKDSKSKTKEKFSTDTNLIAIIIGVVIGVLLIAAIIRWRRPIWVWVSAIPEKFRSTFSKAKREVASAEGESMNGLVEL